MNIADAYQKGKIQGVWLGGDLLTPKEQVIPAGRSRLITVIIAPVRNLIPIHDPRKIILSTRSRYAQLGGEFPHKVIPHLSSALTDPGHKDSTKLQFDNHSMAPIALDAGEVCSIMNRTGPPLSGNTLLDLIAKKDIKLGGKEGKDWWIAKNASGLPIGVGLFIRDDLTWIPPREQPIRPTGDTTRTFREEMEKHFKPVKPGDKARIHIGQTHNTLFTSVNYIAFLDQQTAVAPIPGVRILNSVHTNSPALYGGYPEKPWLIRTETLVTNAELESNPSIKKAVIATFFPVVNERQAALLV